MVNNFGTVQSNIGQMLKGSTGKFWVNAQKEAQGSTSLYKYEGESPHTYHLPGTGNHQGDCLTYSADVNGELITMVSKVKSKLKAIFRCGCISRFRL